eukprot:399651_1
MHKDRDNRKHKHKHKSTKHTDMTSMTNNNNIALIEEISDCVDCLLNAAGEIIKYKISGCVSLKYDHDASIKNKKYVYATVSNLENTKSHIFHPCVEIIDENGKIRIKLENNENSFEILKYIWNAKPNNIKETLPFSIELKTENIEQNVFIVSCVIKPKNHNIHMNEFTIAGSVKDDIIKCIEHTKLNNIDFVWSKDACKKFLWSIKNMDVTDMERNSNTLIKHICNKDKCIVFGYIRKSDLKHLHIPVSIINYCILYVFGIKTYTLVSKFRSTTNNNQVQLKINFKMENICISKIKKK